MSKSYFKHNRHTHTARTHSNAYNDLIPLGVYNSSSPFDPSTFSVPNITWFKGDAGLTKAGTTPISWVNYGTNGGIGTFSNPCIVVSVNGLDAINIPDPGHYVQFTLTNTVQTRSIFAVFKFNAITVGYAPYDIINQDHDVSRGDWEVGLYTNYSPYSYSWMSHSNSSRFLMMSGFNTPSPAGNFYTMGLTNASNTSDNLLTINGVTQSLNQFNAVASNYLVGTIITYIGSYSTISPPDYNMTICELLIFDGAVTATESSKTTTYLRTKWGTA